MVSTASVLGARHLKGVGGEQAGKFACCFPWQSTERVAPTLMWKTGGPVFPPKRRLVAGKPSDRKNKNVMSKQCRSEIICAGDS